LPNAEEGSLFHEYELDAKFLTALAEIDAEHARRVREARCPNCGGALDCADYARKPRPELGEASSAYARRRSFCCRVDGCRQRATPPSLRFFGRRVYIAVVVVIASAAARTMRLRGRGRPERVHDVPIRTVRRWIAWWETVFTVSAFWTEAKAFFARPVDEQQLPASLIARFGGATSKAIETMLGFTSPITTVSVKARIAMVA
jgi:hypothetical protein